MDKFKFSERDFILYLLARIEPKRADLMCLNKLAFLTEFYFKYKTGEELSETKYAAIDHGPVINDYRNILQKMEKEGLVHLKGYKVSPCNENDIQVPEEIQDLIDPVIEKYAQFNNYELRNLSHETDSYKITSNNEKEMGRIIDKDLALLETFFEANNEELSEDELDELLPMVSLEQIKQKAHVVAGK